MQSRHSLVALFAAALAAAPLMVAAQTTPSTSAPQTPAGPDQTTDASQKPTPTHAGKPADLTHPGGMLTSKGSTSRRQNTAADGSKVDNMTHDTATDQPGYAHATPGATPTK